MEKGVSSIHSKEFPTTYLTQAMVAMNEWAKQQIMAYELWVKAELNEDSSFNYGKTPEQLYDLFIKSESK